MSPCKGDTPIFVENKGWTWEPALWMTLSVFIYVYRIDMNIERLMSCSSKHNLHLKNILSSNNKSKQHSTFKSKQKYDKLSLQEQFPFNVDSTLKMKQNPTSDFQRCTTLIQRQYATLKQRRNNVAQRWCNVDITLFQPGIDVS